MVNYRDAVPRRNSFSVCVTQKIDCYRNGFHMNLKTEANTKLFFPSFFFCQQRHLCAKFIVLQEKYRPSPLVLVEQCTLYHLSGKKDNEEKY